MNTLWNCLFVGINRKYLFFYVGGGCVFCVVDVSLVNSKCKSSGEKYNSSQNNLLLSFTLSLFMNLVI